MSDCSSVLKMLLYHSFVELKKKHSRNYSDVAATFVNSKSHIWNSIALNRERTDISIQCHEIQEFYHFKDERFASQKFIKQATSKFFDIQNLFNFLKIKDSSDFIMSHVFILQLIKSFLRHQLNLKSAQF